MHACRRAEAPAYTAPGHHGMTMRRLQGMDVTPSDFAWVGLSHIEPSGGTILAASSSAKIYVVLEGSVTVSNGVEEIVLERWDSVLIPRSEHRMLTNGTDHAAMLLLIMEQR